MLPYYVTRAFLNLVRLLLRTTKKVLGFENLPPTGPYIGVVNHVSIVDAPLFLVALPAMPLHFFAAEKWGEHWIVGPVMKWIGGIFIKRGEVDRRALKEAMKAINNGCVFGLAPEGTRSKSRKMMRAKDGAAYLASRANVPIVPIGLVNTEKVIENAKRLRRTEVEVHIGEPFMLPELERRVKATDLAAYTHYIMIHIASLIPERYHGYYADSPALEALQAGKDPWPHCVLAESEEAMQS